MNTKPENILHDYMKEKYFQKANDHFKNTIKNANSTLALSAGKSSFWCIDYGVGEVFQIQEDEKDKQNRLGYDRLIYSTIHSKSFFSHDRTYMFYVNKYRVSISCIYSCNGKSKSDMEKEFLLDVTELQFSISEEERDSILKMKTTGEQIYEIWRLLLNTTEIRWYLYKSITTSDEEKEFSNRIVLYKTFENYISIIGKEIMIMNFFDSLSPYFFEYKVAFNEIFEEKAPKTPQVYTATNKPIEVIDPAKEYQRCFDVIRLKAVKDTMKDLEKTYATLFPKSFEERRIYINVGYDIAKLLAKNTSNKLSKEGEELLRDRIPFDYFAQCSKFIYDDGPFQIYYDPFADVDSFELIIDARRKYSCNFSLNYYPMNKTVYN